ncbi:putative ATP3-F1F0-ATPase complex, F1 gamma subunit [Atractiella rhizophila]|nr:putative ATP3-F1F0-ATPase complex, F1 gamma subunit [Atractiella rhizophila]
MLPLLRPTPALSRQAGILFTHASVAGRRNFSASPVAAATLKELESRIRSVKNIEKITKSMKMIATTRLNKAQKAMREAKGYGAASTAIFQSIPPPETKDGQKTLYIVPKAQLGRSVPEKLAFSVNQIGRAVPSFEDALAVAELITTQGLEYDVVKIVYNKFISAISFESDILTISSVDALKNSPAFSAYEVEDDELAKDLISFSLANLVFTALVEGHASEISSRRNAMDNASKNAGEMITSLQMQFNTKRQGAITNELVDIITGASGKLTECTSAL